MRIMMSLVEIGSYMCLQLQLFSPEFYDLLVFSAAAWSSYASKLRGVDVCSSSRGLTSRSTNLTQLRRYDLFRIGDANIDEFEICVGVCRVL